jgi:hypothetical protein
MTQKHPSSGTIREAVGVFAGARDIKDAISELMSSGFKHEEMGLLAGEYTVKQSLGDFYTQTNESAGKKDAPNVAFVAKESFGDTVHAYLGTLFFAGTTVAAGAAVVSAAVLGGALLVAVTGAAVMGAVGAALAAIIHQSDAEHLEQQVEEGHLLLFVRTNGAAQEDQAVRILKNHTPMEVRVVTAPALGPRGD